MGKVLVDVIVNCGGGRANLQINGKVILFRLKGVKIISSKERKISLLDLNDLSKYFIFFNIVYIKLIFFIYIFNYECEYI